MNKYDINKEIIYQIYPLSFKDNNNDGFGDLKGIISKLDYLKDLGITSIWLSPIYKSPMYDMGYDVSDYKSIDERFGTMYDFEKLINECKVRNIKVIMDLVLNHTSDEHYWFKEAINHPTTKYRDYFYFKKGKGKKFQHKPNNWQSIFSMSAWTPLENDKTTYYLHLFSKKQVDLNYKNHNVILEIEDIIEFWLKKGVSGFRIDSINNAYKTSLKNGKFRFKYRGCEYYDNQEGLYKLINRLNNDVFKKYDAITIGEYPSANYKLTNFLIDRNYFDLVINFDHLTNIYYKYIPLFKKHFYIKSFLKTLIKYQENVENIALYLENHDQSRIYSRFINNNKYKDLGLKAYATLLFSLKGTPFIYQGQEIGMEDNNLIINDINESNDILVKMLSENKRYKNMPHKVKYKILNHYNRDKVRSPMQWDDSINAGFNQGCKTLFKINKNYIEENINVEYENKNKASLLNYYKKLIKIKLNDEVFIKGEFKLVKYNNKIIKFIRTYKNKKYLIIINLSNKNVLDFNQEDKNLIFSNYQDDYNKFIPPYFSGIYLIA